jgi:hypothetical protein
MALFGWVTIPVIVGAGIVLFLCLIGTATLGFLIMKGKVRLSFSWHVNMARLTVVLAFIHATLAMGWYLGL